MQFFAVVTQMFWNTSLKFHLNVFQAFNADEFSAKLWDMFYVVLFLTSKTNNELTIEITGHVVLKSQSSRKRICVTHRDLICCHGHSK